VFHLFNAGPFVLLILRLASVRKIIYHIHGTIYWQTRSEKITRKISWYLALCRGSKSHKLRFLANSESSKEKFLEQISPTAHIEVLYNPFDVNRFAPVEKKTTPGQDKRIFYVGRLVKGKNLFLWLEAAEYILKYFPQTMFRIVGDGNLKEELLKRIKEKKLENHIEITGYIENIETVYQANDLLLFLSEYESFGNVVVESVLTQTPVIASAIPAMKEIFKDYPEFLVELNEHIFESIIDRLNHYDSLVESVTRARQDFLRRFNLENHLGRVKALYNENEMVIQGEK
jgi:glycosyltransferase involved in cell wall biosynthesis